jgi:hypothetical protein
MRAHYNKYCKILSRVIKEAKRQHCSRLIAKSDNRMSMFGDGGYDNYPMVLTILVSSQTIVMVISL